MASERYEAHESNIRQIHKLIAGKGPDDHAERERLLWNLASIHAGALTPVSEDEKRGMERVLAILERKLGEGGGITGPDYETINNPIENHNRFYRGRWSAFSECILMLRAALSATGGAK